MKVTYDLECNLAQTLNILGDRWTILVLHRIYKNKNTFKELEEALEAIPTNVLSNRIKLLEENGLIYSELYNEHPPRYKYIITEKGKDFNHVFNSMILWAHKYLKNCNKTVCHEKCGNSVQIKYYCENCGEYVDDLVAKESE
ncbi:winged helix-turn-helix transcriptional regulator [Anaerosalibacter massiliensis]|uniref:Helix-turn-helix transcriptional regulator n=1 Tax=Anaerosalibacter massiliensis TaxID=1347392 RepID=A0A9X2S6W5_9FIRM|nr:helix-turn-helix domain-containing protein [Anaerosalibacter massiliensis]MCR2044117.1 helix-turn-helix transcriptional regulator [Anaerosalibacter massiliensis]